MRWVRALVLGVVAGAVLTYAAATTAAVALTAAEADLELAAGPVLVLAVGSSPDGTESTFGLGLGAIPIGCGVVNAAAAAILTRRTR